MTIKKRLLIVFAVLVLLTTFSMIMINKYNRKIVSGLVKAIEENDDIKIEEYMSKSFNINTEYKVLAEANPETALSIACDYGEFELAKRMVLEKGADVNYAPKGYAVPICSIFSRYGNNKPTLEAYIDMYDFFLERDANIKNKNPLFKLAISLKRFISSFGEEGVIKLIDHILDSGVEYGNCQLITDSVIINNLTILKHLIETRKIEINYERYYDSLALLFAVEKNSYECAQYLVDIGFRQDIIMFVGEYEGMSALEIAEAKGDERMIKILKKQ